MKNCDNYYALNIFNTLQRECYMNELSKYNYKYQSLPDHTYNNIIKKCMNDNNDNQEEKLFRINLYNNCIENFCKK